jgi:hypothetical protein
MLIRVCGVMASTSWVVMRSRTTRSMRARPVRSWFWISSPTAHATVAEVVDVVGSVDAVLGRSPSRLHRKVGLAGVQRDDVLDRGNDVVDDSHGVCWSKRACRCRASC